jgi:hypothetical protein
MTPNPNNNAITLTGTDGMTGNANLVATDAYNVPLSGGT